MTLEAGEMAWTREQREWLQALGHDVLALASAVDESPEPQASPLAVEASARPRAKNPGVAAGAASSASPLLRALARAAGRNEDDAELLATVPDLSALRGNPAARRALWPRLRALRKRTSR